MDLSVKRHRRVAALECASDAADKRRDFRRAALLDRRICAAHALAAGTPHESDQGAAYALRGLAAIADVVARNDGDRTSRAIARTVTRVADAVARGVHTALHLAELRALMPPAERMDDEHCAGAVQSMEYALAWLVRPKLVQ